MNVVGRVGSLITQGVYSVATPFHPFGGAVDVIVVQQQDGTFRSTPWYVRFGKFQGVLKGAEKMVRITVNGIEANFHMYLDNSGEAYFIQEAESTKGGEKNGVLEDSDGREVVHEDGTIDQTGNDGENAFDMCRLEHSVSDTRVAELRREELYSSGGLERAESDVDRRYYDFQEEKSSEEGSVELSEFGCNKFESLDGEHVGETQGSDSEVVLISVDGHVLTAPVLASEENTENVQLSTPQFHLGPGEGAEEFNSGDDTWAADYINKLNASASEVASDNAFIVENDDNSLVHRLEVCEGDGEHACQKQCDSETQNIPNLEEDSEMQSDSEDASGRIKREEVFKSCLELSELAKNSVEEMGFLPDVQNSNQETPNGSISVDQAENGVLLEITTNVLHSPRDCNDSGVEVESIDKNVLETENAGSDSISVSSMTICNDIEKKDGTLNMSTSSGGLDVSEPKLATENQCNKSEIVEPESEALPEDLEISREEIQTSSSTRLEISLCGKELQAGMGTAAAAEVFEAYRVSVEEFKNSSTSIIKNEKLVVRYGGMYLPWEKAAPIALGMAAFDLDLPVESKDAISVEQDETSGSREDSASVTSTSSSRIWRLWPIPFGRVKTLEHTTSHASSVELFVDSESGIQNMNVEPSPTCVAGSESHHKQFVRTNVPTSEQIASLNLKDGQNVITFSFCTRVLGLQQVDAHIYLWKWNARIVISDVDGTITKSDVLGQFMPLVGKDWSQSGVAKLFSAIKENGYQLLFLSARAIVQAYLTRSFLFNLKQDGKTLPNGPVVISPDGLFPSLYREVIRRAPHEFKIACLEDIRKLFPPDYNPFYAGFGNRDTDELSYKKIGIPKGKIFIINPKGEVAISHRIDVKSYTNLHTLVNDMFPPTSLVEQEDYNSWNFWRVPLPDIE